MKPVEAYGTRAKLLLKNFFRERDTASVSSILRLMKYSALSRHERFGALSSCLSYFHKYFFSSLILNKALDYARLEMDLVSSSDELSEKRLLNHSIILKSYVSESEKGFILISFEKELRKVLQLPRLRSIQSRYYIIFIPSWSGLYSPELLMLASQSVDYFFVMPVHSHEEEQCRRLSPYCIPLPFNAASWVKSSFFQEAATRDIDCLIVANFGEFKRHWLLFRVIRDLPGVKVVCVGVANGKRNGEHIRKEALVFGVQDRVEVIENPTQEVLREYFSRAKVFCAMSFREGSFIAIAEALQAGTPVVMFENAHVGTKSLINGSNGELVTTVRLFRRAIRRFLEAADHEAIAQEARNEFSSDASVRKLNSLLNAWSDSVGRHWTEEIYPIYSVRLRFFYEDSAACALGVVKDKTFLESINIFLKD